MEMEGVKYEKVQINISYEYNHVGGFTIPEKVYEF